MTGYQVHKEYIWHFTCASCNGYWSIATMDEWTPKKLFCPHCGKEGKVNMKRYHFSNCLLNPSAPPRRPRPKVTEEIKSRMSIGCLAKPIIKCPHCEKEGKSNMKRYHFDNCKKRDKSESD